jgi:hypothetical protein
MSQPRPYIRSMPARLCAALVVCVGTALGLGGSAYTAGGPSLSFAEVRHYAIGKRPCSIAIGELNGDGKRDVVTTDCESTLSVFLNRGDGTFDAKRDYTPERPGNVEVADLNGDGKNDLLTTNDGPRVSVLMNQGDGTFGASASYALGRPPQGLLIADLNGDDKADLVAKTSTDTASAVSILLNRGDGDFGPKRDYLAASGWGDIALGDLNGDGKPELVIVKPYEDLGRLLVLLNGGDGSFETRRDYEVPFIGRVAIGDLNGDGKADLATEQDTPGGAYVLLNLGDGTFRTPRSYDYCRSAQCNSPEPLEIAIRDLNGDDKADLVTLWDDIRYGELHESNWYVVGVSVLLNKGDGRFSMHNYELNSPFERGNGVAPLAIGDLNGDGKPEIATATDGVSVNVQLNKGDGRFEPSLSYPLSYSESADLNSDGRTDLVGANRARGVFSVRLNRPGLCNVQSVRRRTFAAAKRRLGRVNCRIGKVSRAYNKWVGRGHVISQKPMFGAVLPGGAKVKVVVSRGSPPRRRRG